MSNESRSLSIPYFESDVINQLIQAHNRELGGQLRAVIAFGSLVTEESRYDIDLLEVVDQWQDISRFQANSTTELPLRGRLFLTLISAEAFVALAAGQAAQPDINALLNQILQGYEVIYETPAGFAHNVLDRARAAAREAKGGEILTNPLQLPVNDKARAA